MLGTIVEVVEYRDSWIK